MCFFVAQLDEVDSLILTIRENKEKCNIKSITNLRFKSGWKLELHLPD